MRENKKERRRETEIGLKQNPEEEVRTKNEERREQE